MVTREPEWDDAQRELLQALDLYEAGVCNDCGIHHSLSGDLENVFTFSERICNTCAGSDRYARMMAEAEEKVRKMREGAPAASPLPSDGRKVYLRQMSPQEIEMERAKRSAFSTRG